MHSDIGKNVGADRVKELGQVHDECTVGVQAWTSLETSEGIGDALDTRQRPEVQMSQNQTWKVRAAIIVYHAVLQRAMFGIGSTGPIRITLSSQILNRGRVSQGMKTFKNTRLKREKSMLEKFYRINYMLIEGFLLIFTYSYVIMYFDHTNT